MDGIGTGTVNDPEPRVRRQRQRRNARRAACRSRSQRPTCPCTIWVRRRCPRRRDDGDPSAVELGTRFRSDVGGYITGIRFYKAAANTGTHVGRLWTNTGTLLGTVTFSGETASGWQQANFASPIPITANTTYVVSYHAPNGHYTGTDPCFANSASTGRRCTALRDGIDGANGVYRYGAGGCPQPTPTSRRATGSTWCSTRCAPPDTTPPTVTAVFPAADRRQRRSRRAPSPRRSAKRWIPRRSRRAPPASSAPRPAAFELRDPLNTLVSAPSPTTGHTHAPRCARRPH